MEQHKSAKDKRYHYNYHVTLLDGKMYYGSRSSNDSPETDLWINYFTSSFELKRELVKGNYPVRTLFLKFNSRKEAYAHEIETIKRFKLTLNEKYLNKTTATEQQCNKYIWNGQIFTYQELIPYMKYPMTSSSFSDAFRGGKSVDDILSGKSERRPYWYDDRFWSAPALIKQLNGSVSVHIFKKRINKYGWSIFNAASEPI